MARLSDLFSLSKCIQIVQAYAPYYLQGIVYTLLLSLAAIAVGFVFALLLTLMRRSRITPLRYLSIAYVEIIREVAEFYSLPVLDLYKNSGLQPRLPVIQQMYMPDGLHPNDAGHRVLADQIVQFLRTL